MTLDGFGKVYCSSGDARWCGPPHYSFQHPSSRKCLVPAYLWRGRSGDIRVSWGTVVIVTVPNSGIQSVGSSCLAMGDFGRMPSHNTSNMTAATGVDGDRGSVSGSSASCRTNPRGPVTNGQPAKCVPRTAFSARVAAR